MSFFTVLVYKVLWGDKYVPQVCCWGVKVSFRGERNFLVVINLGLD